MQDHPPLKTNLDTQGNDNQSTVQNGDGNRVQIHNYHVKIYNEASSTTSANSKDKDIAPEVIEALQFLIGQNEDLHTKLEAIREYNRLMGNISPSKIVWDGR